jgi:hypothetical protein
MEFYMVTALTLSGFTSAFATSYFYGTGNLGGYTTFTDVDPTNTISGIFDFTGTEGTVDPPKPPTPPHLAATDITIGGTTLDNFASGDVEIGFVVTSNGTDYCFNADEVYFTKDGSGDVENQTFTVWGDSEYSVEVDGYQNGESMSVCIYVHSTSTLYTLAEFTWVDMFDNEKTNTYSSGTRYFTDLDAYSNANPVSPAVGAIQQPVDVTLVWTNMDAVADSYNVYVNTTNDFTGITPTNVTSGHTLDLTGLTPGNRYYWRADAELSGSFVTGGVGNFYVKPNTPAITTPADGTTNIATDEIVFTFDAINGADEYIINIDGTDHTVAGSPATVSGLTLANCDDIPVTIQAVNAAGNNSDVAAAITYTTVPGMVALTAPANNAKEQVFSPMFTWDASAAEVACVDNYTFTLKQGTTTIEEITGMTTTSHTTTKVLDPMTTYTWTVTPFNGTVAGTAATEFTFRTKMDCFASTTIDPENAEIQVSTTPDFTWGAVTGATNYDILVEKLDGTDILTDNVTTNAYTWGGTALDFETQYQWTITARNADGETIECGPYTFTSKLASPNPTYPADGDICVPLAGTMTWDAFTGANQYEVEYKLATEDWSAATSTKFAAGTTEWAYSGNTFARNSDYVWRIQAEKGGIWTGWSEENAFSTVLNPLTQTAPANGEKGLDKDNVDLTVDAATGATTYTFEVATDNAFSNTVVNVAETTATTNVAGLEYGTMYYWRATSDACGTTDASEATVWTFTTTPDAVTLTNPANTATDVSSFDTWTWTAVQGADGYELAYGTTVGNLDQVYTTTTNSLAFVGLESSTTYFWNVRPYQNKLDGTKAYGEFVATPFSFTTKDLSAPKIVSPANGAINQMLDVMLTWETVSEAEFYGLQVALDDNFTNRLVDLSDETDNVTQTNYLLLNEEISAMTYGTTLYWRLLTAVDDGNGTIEYSAWSPAYSFTLLPAPAVTGKEVVCNVDDLDYSTEVYTTPAISNATYAWSVSEGGTILSQNNNEVTVLWTTAGTHTVNVTRSGDQWKQWDTPNDKWVPFTDSGVSNAIAVNDPTEPTVVISIDDWEMTGGTTYCVNERVVLTAAVSDADGFAYATDTAKEYWVVENVDGSETTYNSGDVNWKVWDVPGTYTVSYYILSDETNCMLYEYTTDIEISDQCDVKAVFEQEPEICKGAGATQLDIYVYGGDGSAYDYAWAPATKFTLSDVMEPAIKPAYTNFTFTLNVTDQAGNTFSENKTTTMLYKPTPSLDRVIVLGAATPNPFDLENSNPGTTIIEDWDHESATALTEAEWTDRYGSALTESPNAVTLAAGLNIFYLRMWNANHDCYYGPSRIVLYKQRIKEVSDENFTTGANGTAFMSAYPNPTVDKVNVDIEFVENTVANVSVINIEGKTVKSFDSVTGTRLTNTYNVEDLQAGTYFMLVETNDDTVIWKFIKL